MGDGADPATSELDPEHDERPRLVRFVVGGRELLIDVSAVIEVLVPGPVTRLPGSAGAIDGVTSVRGRIVAVVDPSRALGATAPADRARFLVVTTPDGPVALVVDRVDAVVATELDPEDADADDDADADRPTDDDPSTDGLLTVATATIDGRTLAVIDPVALVHAAIGLAPAGAAPP